MRYIARKEPSASRAGSHSTATNRLSLICCVVRGGMNRYPPCMDWLRLAVTALLCGIMSGCAAQKPVATGEGALSRRDSLRTMDPVRIQGDIMGFADRFVTAMVDVYDELERRTPTKESKDIAHKLKTDMALAAISNAVNADSITGLMDMLVMVQLQSQIAQTAWMQKTFATDADPLRDALKQQRTDLHSLASRYLTDSQLAQVSEVAERWNRAHPDLRYISHVHLAGLPVPNAPPPRAEEGPGSLLAFLFKPTPTLDPAVHEVELSRATSERMFFYLQRLPMLLQLQADDLYREMGTAPRFERALDDLSTVSSSTTRFAEISSRFTDIAGRYPQQLAEQREQALGQFSSELTQQRDAGIRQMTTSLQQEQQAFVSNLEGAADRWADHLVGRLAAVALILLVLSVMGVFVYRSLSRRREARTIGASAPLRYSAPELDLPERARRGTL